MHAHIIHPNQFLFVGPSPSSGNNFVVTGLGGYELHNRYQNSGADINLLQQVNRVNSISYAFGSIERIDVKQLGTKGVVSRPLINQSEGQLSFSYTANNIRNEARLGLFCDYSSGTTNRTPFFNRDVPILSGMCDRTLIRVPSNPFWFYRSNDSRNFFLGILGEGQEFFNPQSSGNHAYRFVEPRAQQCNALSFTDCYLNSYSFQAAVGSLPTAQVSYTCSNIGFAISGSGFAVPTLNTSTRANVTNPTYAVLPRAVNEKTTTLIPGDITATIADINNAEIVDLGLNFSNLKIQSVDINLDIPREPLYSLGAKAAIDRKIVFPAFCSMSLETIPGALSTGSINSLLSFKDSGFNVTVVLKNENCPGVPLAGEPIIQYKVKDAKFNGISYSDNIGTSKTANLNFTVDVLPDDATRGLFLSGVLGGDLSLITSLPV